ncbi:hypothetical protein EC973_009678 [Apophysomyces ossiformis]|uniref:Uncharacterized protein n=1 Tax=Apophysomyces ossiformis TaxID=679940 RepID=A0A8H7BR17_9FUNG|nr:hypothetical protein EC973_009678 [Apophysomyces ossiformis]
MRMCLPDDFASPIVLPNLLSMAQETTGHNERSTCPILQKDVLQSTHLPKEMRDYSVSRLIDDRLIDATPVSKSDVITSSILEKESDIDQYHLSSGSHVEASSSESSSSKVTTNRSMDDQESLKSDALSDVSIGSIKPQSIQDVVESWHICGEPAPAPHLRMARPKPKRPNRTVDHCALLVDDGSKWCNGTASENSGAECVDEKVSSSGSDIKREEASNVSSVEQTMSPYKSGESRRTENDMVQSGLDWQLAEQYKWKGTDLMDNPDRDEELVHLRPEIDMDGLSATVEGHIATDVEKQHIENDNSSVVTAPEYSMENNTTPLSSRRTSIQTEASKSYKDEHSVRQAKTSISPCPAQIHGRPRKSGTSMIPRSCNSPNKRNHNRDILEVDSPGVKHPLVPSSSRLTRRSPEDSPNTASPYMQRQVSKIPVRDVRAQPAPSQPKKNVRTGNSKLPTRMTKH